jgi:hypothetical protein
MDGVASSSLFLGGSEGGGPSSLCLVDSHG